MSVALVILAAGQGTRMNSDLPKVLHTVAGAPLFAHAIASGSALNPERTILVTGHGSDQVRAAAQKIDPEIEIVEQTEQLGTAHAVLQAKELLADFKGDIVVLYGDTPFLRPETLLALADARKSSDVVVLGFDAADPGRYGRLVMDGDKLDRIVEFKDATEAERKITFCNSGIKIASAETMFSLVASVKDDNAAKEFYLTDIIELAGERGLQASAIACDESETLGINTRAQLAEAEQAYQNRARSAAVENGTTLQAPDTVYFSYDTFLGRDVTVEPNVVFGTGVTVETGATIRAFSHLEGCHVGSDAIVGPYARLRPGAELSNNTRVGNFVEIKNAAIGEGSKVNHLSYVGDATVGDATNIGAGTITCNYDGVMKHHTQIGDRVFVGSNTLLVAPVSVGNDAMTASGTVVTSNIPDGAMAISRVKQENKPGMAVRLFSKLKAAKAARNK